MNKEKTMQDLEFWRQKLKKSRAIYKETNSWEDFEEVTLCELMILIAEKEIKNGS